MSDLDRTYDGLNELTKVNFLESFRWLSGWHLKGVGEHLELSIERDGGHVDFEVTVSAKSIRFKHKGGSHRDASGHMARIWAHIDEFYTRHK